MRERGRLTQAIGGNKSEEEGDKRRKYRGNYERKRIINT